MERLSKVLAQLKQYQKSQISDWEKKTIPGKHSVLKYHIGEDGRIVRRFCRIREEPEP